MLPSVQTCRFVEGPRITFEREDVGGALGEVFDRELAPADRDVDGGDGAFDREHLQEFRGDGEGRRDWDGGRLGLYTPAATGTLGFRPAMPPRASFGAVESRPTKGLRAGSSGALESALWLSPRGDVMAQLSSDAFAFGGELMRVEDALALVGERLAPVAAKERVGLVAADGRVLADDLLAPIDLPSFANSAVDGYAVAFVDLAKEGPTTLPLVGRIAAGQAPKAPGGRGVAMRIFTGAPMPENADTVFMQEDVRVPENGGVELPPGLARGANCRPVGEDIARGAIALPAGRRLEPRDVALAAALGVSALDVRARPRVAVFSTGDELCEPGSALPPAGIYDSNRFALAALLKRSGCDVTDLGVLRDKRDLISAALSDAAGNHDLIVTSGGVSTGEEDHVRAAVEAAGSLTFWRLAIKPGRPVAMGVVRGTPLVGLPGNPVAVFVTYAHVLRPLIARIAGTVPTPLAPLPVEAGFGYRKKAGRREYVRVRLAREGGRTVAHKHPVDGAGVITSLTLTDGMVELGEELTRLEPGDVVPFLDYRQVI